MFDLGIKSEGLNNRGFNNKHVITYLSMLDSAADRLQVYYIVFTIHNLKLET